MNISAPAARRILALAFAILICPQLISAQRPTLQSETPQKFTPTNDGFDHIRRDVMIPMRDGVKLHTVILVPKGAKGAPILLTRTPYNATDLTTSRARVRILVQS